MNPKFRAWVKDEKRMLPVGDLDTSYKLVYLEEDNGYRYERDFDEIELMQSTGLKDKNGKEIYEGDIVRYKGYWSTRVEEVSYDKNFAYFGLKNSVADIIYSFGDLPEYIDLKSLKVIGNIYKNPELLKKY